MSFASEGGSACSRSASIDLGNDTLDTPPIPVMSNVTSDQPPPALHLATSTTEEAAANSTTAMVTAPRPRNTTRAQYQGATPSASSVGRLETSETDNDDESKSRSRCTRKRVSVGVAIGVCAVIIITIIGSSISRGSGVPPPGVLMPEPPNSTDSASQTQAPMSPPPPPPPQTNAAGELLWTDACTPSGPFASRQRHAEYLRRRVQQMLSYGTRVAGSGSTGYNTVHSMITTMAACSGMWTVEHDNFTELTPIGEKRFSNIVSRFEAGNPALGHIVLAAHFDSKLFTDFVFLGASDSAAPCVLILEIMKAVSQRAIELQASDGGGPSALPAITAMFFDGEEAFVSWQGTDNTYGSRHLAQVWESDGRLKTISLFVLLDLLGPRNPRFHNYFPEASGASYHRMRNIEVALRNGGGALTPLLSPSEAFFPNEVRSAYGGVEDDHIPWMRRGVPILHLIPIPFPDVWHKAGDNIAAIDAATTYDLLQIVQNFTLTFSKTITSRKRRGSDAQR